MVATHNPTATAAAAAVVRPPPPQPPTSSSASPPAAFVEAVAAYVLSLRDLPSFCNEGRPYRRSATTGRRLDRRICRRTVQEVVAKGEAFFADVSVRHTTYRALQLRLCEEFRCQLRAADTAGGSTVGVLPASGGGDEVGPTTAADDAACQLWMDQLHKTAQEATACVGGERGWSVSKKKKKSVSFVCPGTAVRAQNVKLIPALNDVEGTVVEALPYDSSPTTRLLVEFPPPFNTLRLSSRNVALAAP